ncbi:hypothetical protein [Roseateles albus]|uniref:TonB-dependent receptor n=1 Tax=Roseateles albus TaxID=2987525 RepID=A0ABT5K925_9BURK|nr:hypothetical protein [Roseateles albus]MDC8770421.1 hypothetical protein [Roseateles albus]
MRTPAFVSVLFAATLFAAGAHAAEAAEPAQLDRVVITGKSVRPELVQLPRVVVTGLSAKSQMQQLMLAAAKPTVRRV